MIPHCVADHFNGNYEQLFSFTNPECAEVAAAAAETAPADAERAPWDNAEEWAFHDAQLALAEQQQASAPPEQHVISSSSGRWATRRGAGDKHFDRRISQQVEKV